MKWLSQIFGQKHGASAAVGNAPPSHTQAGNDLRAMTVACIGPFEQHTKPTADILPSNPNSGAAPNAWLFADELIGAVKAQDLPRVKLLLAQKVDPSHPTRNGECPLVVAIQTGNLELVKTLLAAGATPNMYHCTNDSTPLIAAVGNVAMLRLLLTSGANPNLGLRVSGLTPLHVATAACDVDSIRVLLELGANPKHLTSWGLTPLGEVYRKLIVPPNLPTYGLDRPPPPAPEQIRAAIEEFIEHGEPESTWAVFAKFLKR